MSGIEKLRTLCGEASSWGTGQEVVRRVVPVEVDKIRDLASQIEREHAEELDERIVVICRQDDEIAQLRADLAAAKRKKAKAAKRADMAAATLNDVSEMAFGEVRGPEHAGELLVELGKRLMPQGMEWLRYDDGEKVLPSDEGIIGIEYSQTGNTVLVTTSDDEPRVVFAPGERVKRPEPEVLGADGLPIKVGETVYSTYDDITETVKSITHAPFGYEVIFESGFWDRPEVVTHTPPETQERIDEDKRKEPCEYWKCGDALCDSCPAKIDGEKPYERYGVVLCGIAQGRDIARRKQELDARTIGGDAS